MKSVVNLVAVFTLMTFVVAGPDQLPSLSDIIKTVKAPKKFLLGKCELDVKIDDKKITIEIAVDNCQINLKEIIDHFFPSNKLDEETKTFLVSQIVFMKLEIDTEKKTVEFEAKSPTKVALVYDKVFKAEWSISDRFLNIKFSYEKAFNYQNIGVKLSGKLGIGKQDILLEFEKKEGEKKMSFKANTGSVDIKLSVKDLVGVIGLEEKIKEMFGEETLQKKIVDFAMESISFEGVFDPTTYDIELVVSGAVKTDLAQKVKFYFVLIKMQGEPYKIAVVGNVESLEFQKLVDMVVGKKTEIDFLKGKSLNAIIMAATDNILVLQNKDLVDVIKDVPKEENAAIPKGPTIVLDIGTAIEDESKSKEKRKQLYMRYADKKFTFKFIPNLELDLLNTLQMFVKKSVKTELPKWLGEISGKIKFEKFDFDFAGSLDLQIFVPGQLKIGSLLTIADVKIKVLRKAGQDMWDFSIESLTQITKDVTLEIGIEKIEGSYELKGQIPKISLKELLKYFVSNDKFASGEFEKFNMDLKAVSIRWILPESKPTALKLSADVDMTDFTGVQFQLIAVVENNVPEWKMGFSVPKVELCDMMKKFFGKDLENACWLKDVDYAIAMDGIKTDVQFDLQPLKGIPKQSKGFYFRLKIQFPKDCAGNKLCLEAKRILEKRKSKRSGSKDEIIVTLEGVIRDTNSFSVAAKLELEEKLSESVTLSEYQLLIDMDGVKGSLYFGVKLRFENKKSSFDMIEFGGKISVGRPESKKKIDAKLALSISLTSIDDIYYYAKVSSMTVEDILDLFELKAPNALKDTGFPNGFTVAFSLSPSGKEIKALGKRIDSGLTIIGDLRLFELQLSCKITIDANQPKFLIYIQMSAIKLTLISFTKVRGDENEGPEFYAEISSKKKEVKINAKVTVLGISAGTVIQVSDSHYVFTVNGKIFGTLEAELTCKAKYASLKDAEFSVAGKLSFKDTKELTKEVETQLDDAKEKTKVVMDETAKALKNIERMGQTQKSAETRYKQRLLDVQEEIKKDVADINKLTEIKDCVKKCKQVSLGGVVWKENCILVSDINGKKEYVGCPEWKDSIYSYPDLGCIAECKGESWYEVLWADTKQITARISDSIGENLDSAINFFKEVWDKVEALVDDAKVLYDKVKSAVKAGLDILAGALTDVIKFIGVTEASFETTLKAAATAEIELAVVIDGKKYNVKASLNGNVLKEISAVIIEHVYSGYGSLVGGLKKARGYISDVASKLGIVEKELDKASQEKSSKGTRRSYVPSKKEMEIKRLIYDPLPRPVQNDYATVRVFENFKPEKLMAYESIPTEKKYRIEDHRPSRRSTIDALVNSDPCDQLRFVVDGYTKISNILRSLKSAFIQQEKSFRRSVSQKRNRLKKMGKTFARKCKKTPGCNSERLEDILHYVKKTRDATTNWVHAVRSKVKKQNKEAFNIWRKNLNAIYNKRRGMSVKEFASEMHTTAVSRADTRSFISHEEADGLSLISKYVGDLFDEKTPMTIMDAYPTIVKINKKVAELGKSSKFSEKCQNAKK
eukprot:gene14013-4985_t